jgi:hypothetical protein
VQVSVELLGDISCEADYNETVFVFSMSATIGGNATFSETTCTNHSDGIDVTTEATVPLAVAFASMCAGGMACDSVMAFVNYNLNATVLQYWLVEFSTLLDGRRRLDGELDVRRLSLADATVGDVGAATFVPSPAPTQVPTQMPTPMPSTPGPTAQPSLMPVPAPTANPTVTFSPTMTFAPTTSLSPVVSTKSGDADDDDGLTVGLSVGGAAAFVLIVASVIAFLVYRKKKLDKEAAAAASPGDDEMVENPNYDVRDDLVDTDLIEIDAQDRAFALGEVMEA